MEESSIEKPVTKPGLMLRPLDYIVMVAVFGYAFVGYVIFPLINHLTT